jgi:hypothetical protein
VADGAPSADASQTDEAQPSTAASPTRLDALSNLLWHERPRCRLCGEPIVLDDPDDLMSWIHAEDANDQGDHTAEE